MRTKAESARLVALGLAHETFQHETLGHFDITVLREAIDIALSRPPGLTLYRCRFDEVEMVDGIKVDAFEYLTSNREIDYEHAKSFTKQQLAEPLLFLKCPPGSNGEGESHLLVDGIHRMYERKRRGKTFFRYYLVPLEIAPRVDPEVWQEVKWGEKDVVPGVGLVKREQ